jgi:hypothetical protein
MLAKADGVSGDDDGYYSDGDGAVDKGRNGDSGKRDWGQSDEDMQEKGERWSSNSPSPLCRSSALQRGLTAFFVLYVWLAMKKLNLVVKQGEEVWVKRLLRVAVVVEMSTFGVVADSGGCNSAPAVQSK